jgi:hypothetical protein
MWSHVVHVFSHHTNIYSRQVARFILSNVFQIFRYVCCKWFHLNVCNVGNGYTRGFQVFLVYCKCFRRMLQVFQLFQTYVANVFSRCCKSKYGCCTYCSGSHLLQLLGLPACAWVWKGRERDTVRAQIETKHRKTHRVVRDMVRVWDTERRGPSREAA